MLTWPRKRLHHGPTRHQHGARDEDRPRRPQDDPKTAPRPLQDHPSRPQDGPKSASRRPYTAPRQLKTVHLRPRDGPNMAQESRDGSKTAQDGFKIATIPPQNGPKTAHDGPLTASRRPQHGPKTWHRCPENPQSYIRTVVVEFILELSGRFHDHRKHYVFI